MPKELEDQEEFSVDSALADISSELFGPDTETDVTSAEKAPEEAVEVTPAEREAQAVEEASPPRPEGEGETSQEVQDIGAPKTWTKEALAEWATISPRAQQEILKREEDFLKGITQYKAAAETGQRYDSVVAPFRQALEAENIDPVGLFQSFASNHYLLSRGTEDQKLQLTAHLIHGYNIDFAKLVDYIGEQTLNPPDPRVLALEKEVQELRQSSQASQQQASETQQQALLSEIEAFAADPAHPYFADVVGDIDALFKSGQAKTLQEAYDKAIYLNPVTRQKEVDRLTAEKLALQQTSATEVQNKIAKTTAADLSLSQKTRDGTVSLGSIDDTLHETMARIAARS